MTTRRVSRVRGGDSVSGPRELDAVLKGLHKDYGSNVVFRGSSIIQPPRIPTDIFTLDFCLLGGIPVGRASMFEGEKHAGKTLVASKTVAGAQRLFPDQQVAYMDIEGTYDSVWAAKLGVNTSDLLVIQPETGEHAVDIADALTRTFDISLIVVDSVAALTPFKEIEASAEDSLVGAQARLVSSMVRKLTVGMIAERHRGHNVTILFINQFRSQIGGYNPHGAARTVPGGRALAFSLSVEAVIKNKENSGKDTNGIDVIDENEHAFTIVKNKLNGGPRTGEFRVRRTYSEDSGLEEGAIDDANTMLAFAKKFGKYTGGGSSWQLDVGDASYKFRGMAQTVAALYEDPELRQALRNSLIYEQAATLGMPEDFLAGLLP